MPAGGALLRRSVIEDRTSPLCWQKDVAKVDGEVDEAHNAEAKKGRCNGEACHAGQRSDAPSAFGVGSKAVTSRLVSRAGGGPCVRNRRHGKEEHRRSLSGSIALRQGSATGRGQRGLPGGRPKRL